MTRTSDLEATMEQHKAEVAAAIAENSERFDQMQEMIEKNKDETNKQMAEVLQLLKALQPPTTTIALTSQTSPLQPPPFTTTGTPQPPPFTTTAPPPPPFTTTAPLPPPYYNFPPFTHTIIPLPPPTQPSAAYTSFSGIRFDSQGHPIPSAPIGEVFGSFSTWEDHGVHSRRQPPENVFQNFSDQPGVFQSEGSPAKYRPCRRVWGMNGDGDKELMSV